MLSSQLFALSLVIAVVGATSVRADPVAEFYRGKTVSMLIGVGVGGEYDLQARLVARHIGKHIPGNPTVVAQNMTGAGGLKMTNWLAAVAPRDGTVVAMIQNSFPALQAAGLPGVQFDASKFYWLGTIAPVVETMAVWHTSGARTIEDARTREIVAGASAKGAITYTYPALMNELFGTRFKIVTGYTGGNQINLAMERDEVRGAQQYLVELESDQARLARREEDRRRRPGGAARPRSRCAVPGSHGEDSRGPAVDRAGRLRHAARAPVRHHAGRPGGTHRGAARGVRRHHAGSGVPGGSGGDEFRGHAGARRSRCRKSSTRCWRRRRASRRAPDTCWNRKK